jgi:hypothetical protein
MEYKAFIISDYRAIKGPLQISLDRSNVVPIIGVNECGKTTILQAILCFDSFNDDVLGGRHLVDIENLYSPKPPAPCVTAVVKLKWEELIEALEKVCADRNSKAGLKSYKEKKFKFTGEIEIERNLITKRYRIPNGSFMYGVLNAQLVGEIVKRLPFTIYFDDFRDSIKEKIEIPATGQSDDFWYEVVDVLFAKSGCGITLADLPSCEERRRKAALSKVNAHLKKILTREWQSFRLDDVDALKVSVDFESSPVEIQSKSADGKIIRTEVVKDMIKFEVVETTESGEEHFFYIRDRSKGFFWFFNFVMKLQFNPSEAGHSDSQKAVFLLDEPGCYLHATAQKKLCKKLVEIATDNVVIYCTHSHYLLDPKVVPIQSVRIADRGSNDEVQLKAISSYKSDLHVNRTAFQPVIDALQLTPFSMELIGKQVVIVEGVTDFYAMTSYFGEEFQFLPSVGADSVKYSVPFLLASATQFCAVWDRDEKGIEARNAALKDFGEEFTSKFLLLPQIGGHKKVTLEKLFSKNDLKRLGTETGFPENADPKKIFSAVFYSQHRNDLIKACDGETNKAFAALRAELNSAFLTASGLS